MRLVFVIVLDLFVNKVIENFVVAPGFLPQLVLSCLPPAPSGPLPLFCGSSPRPATQLPAPPRPSEACFFKSIAV